MGLSYASFQSLYIQMLNDGKLSASGTGFTVLSSSGKPYLITNRHNVTGRNNMTGEMLPPYSPPDSLAVWHCINKDSEHGIEFVGGGYFLWDEYREPLYDGSGEPLWLEHPILKAKADFVALPLTSTYNAVIRPYEVKDVMLSLMPSTTVNIVGFPFGNSSGGRLPIWNTGFIASEIDLSYNDLPQFLVDSRTRPGQSGSPVVCYVTGLITDNSGTLTNEYVGQTLLLGIYSGRINSESDIGIVWKAAAIKELVDTLP